MKYTIKLKNECIILNVFHLSNYRMYMQLKLYNTCFSDDCYLFSDWWCVVWHFINIVFGKCRLLIKWIIIYFVYTFMEIMKFKKMSNFQPPCHSYTADLLGGIFVCSLQTHGNKLHIMYKRSIISNSSPYRNSACTTCICFGKYIVM